MQQHLTPAQLIERLNSSCQQSRDREPQKQRLQDEIDELVSARLLKQRELSQCSQGLSSQRLLITDLESRIRELKIYKDDRSRQHVNQLALQTQSFKTKLCSFRSHSASTVQVRTDMWDTLRLLRIQLEEQLRVNRELIEWRNYLREHYSRFSSQNSQLSRLGV